LKKRLKFENHLSGSFFWSAQISGTAFVIGGFFLANWMKKRR